jgi:hypothetical protein
VSTIVLRNYLTLDRGDEGKARYSDQAAEDAIRIFREAVAFAKLTGTDAEPTAADETNSLAKEDASPEVTDMGGSRATGVGEAPHAADQTVVSPGRGERELLSGLLSKTAGFRLLVYGQVGPKEIDRLVAKLELDKEILADPEEGPSS